MGGWGGAESFHCQTQPCVKIKTNCWLNDTQVWGSWVAPFRFLQLYFVQFPNLDLFGFPVELVLFTRLYCIVYLDKLF